MSCFRWPVAKYWLRCAEQPPGRSAHWAQTWICMNSRIPQTSYYPYLQKNKLTLWMNHFHSVFCQWPRLFLSTWVTKTALSLWTSRHSHLQNGHNRIYSPLWSWVDWINEGGGWSSWKFWGEENFLSLLWSCSRKWFCYKGINTSSCLSKQMKTTNEAERRPMQVFPIALQSDGKR